jgi:hypothetical protein
LSTSELIPHDTQTIPKQAETTPISMEYLEPEYYSPDVPLNLKTPEIKEFQGFYLISG